MITTSIINLIQESDVLVHRLKVEVFALDKEKTKILSHLKNHWYFLIYLAVQLTQKKLL